MPSPAPVPMPDLTARIATNRPIAARLARYGDLLADAGGDRFRIWSSPLKVVHQLG